MSEPTITGTVKWFNATKGYGFLATASHGDLWPVVAPSRPISNDRPNESPAAIHRTALVMPYSSSASSIPTA